MEQSYRSEELDGDARICQIGMFLGYNRKMNDKLISKIESRLQFVITVLTIFLFAFPTLNPSGYIIVVVYIITYILFAIFDTRINEKWLKQINTVVLIGIGSFLIPLTLVALTGINATMPLWQAYTWLGSTLISTFLMLSAPIVLIILILTTGIKARNKIKAN